MNDTVKKPHVELKTPIMTSGKLLCKHEKQYASRETGKRKVGKTFYRYEDEEIKVSVGGAVCHFI